MNRDQRDIMRLIAERVKMGLKKYGHGLEVDSGYDWPREALEEVSDGLQYVAVALLQVARGNKNGKR